MKHIFQVFLLLTFIGFVFIAGTYITHAQGIVPCGNGSAISSGFISDECTLCHLQILAVRFVNFVILLATAFAALLFMNAGFLYVMSPSNPGNISKAHHLFTNTLIGFVILLSSWLIVNLVMTTLIDSGTFGDWKNVLCTSSTQETTPVKIDTISIPVAAGPGYVASDFQGSGTGSVLSSSAITSGKGNLQNNCTVSGGKSCAQYIQEKAIAEGVDPAYALALATIESGGCKDPTSCISGSNAVGVTQILPGTARGLCGSTCSSMSDAQMTEYLKNPQNNIDLGVKYMKQSAAYVEQQKTLYPERFQVGREQDYMAAYYNGGPTALQASKDCGSTMTKYECTSNPGGYVQTQDYVEKMNTFVNSVNAAK